MHDGVLLIFLLVSHAYSTDKEHIIHDLLEQVESLLDRIDLLTAQ